MFNHASPTAWLTIVDHYEHLEDRLQFELSLFSSSYVHDMRHATLDNDNRLECGQGVRVDLVWTNISQL